jgi:formamidopyrimidine-DNA glycosylase
VPELPEVETIRRALQHGGRGGAAIIGWQVQRVDLLWDRLLATGNKKGFLDEINGQKVIAVNRRAKFLDLEFDRHHLIFHLRMSGDIRVEENQHPSQKHDRMLLFFENGFHLAFNDTRKFGRIWFVEDPQEIWANLGPEPFDETLTASLFFDLLQRKKRKIKPLLMDQSFLAGLGNIYTDEALFQAKIHPVRNSGSISQLEAENLLVAIRDQLSEGIKNNGSSIDWVYRGGNFQNTFQVYGKNGKECSICGTVIEKMQVGQRGTHFCPSCQVLFRLNPGIKEG